MADIRFAVIADVHGNRWALEAVLEDVERRGVAQVLNLGDSLHGPLDPAGTAALLQSGNLLSIRGNQDREILEPGPEAAWSPTLRFVREELGPMDLEWLGGHRPSVELFEGRVLLCHGTPERDDHYLAERVSERGVEIKTPEDLEAELKGVTAEVILCGHSHVPRVLGITGGKLVINPGSVGLAAYNEVQPYPHAMEAGSPHSRYAILSYGERGWRVEQIAVSYDWERAAREASKRGRLDWAEWIRSGRARP